MIILGRERSDYIAERTTGPDELPVTLAEAKEHLREDSSDFDALIRSLIGAATNIVEAQVGKALVSQTWTVSLPRQDANDRFVLPANPARSITSISYYDRDNVSQTATVTDYYFVKTENQAYLEPQADKNWPALYSRADALTVVYVAGFGAASAVPENLKQAIKLIVGDWYENRSEGVVGAMTNEVHMAAPVAALIDPHKIGFFAA